MHSNSTPALSALSADNRDMADLVADPDDEAAGGRPEVTLPGPQDIIWRYRRELTPLLVALTLVGVAQWGHADHPAAWPWALALGGGATGAWWWRRGLRPPAPAYVLTVGAFAAAWLLLAWVAGPVHRWLLVPLATATLLAAVPWWDHQMPRPGLEAKDADAPAELRERVAALVKHWEQIATAQGLSGVRIQPPVLVDRYGWRWRLRLPTMTKLTVRELIAAAPRLDKVFRVPAGGTRMELDSGRADRVLMRVNVSNPLGEAMPYEPPTEMRSIAEPLTAGRFEDRAPVELVLPGRHLLGVGRSGSGKSVLQEVLLYELMACRDAVIWVIDVAKHGVRFRDLEPALDWLALEVAEARAMFLALTEVQDARARWMGEAGHKRWPLSPEHPQLVVLVDEYADLMGLDGFDELANQVAMKGREQGITLLAWSQRGTAKELGGSVFVRTQCELRVALAMDTPDVDVVLDRGAHAAGFQPEHFTDGGMFYLRAPWQRVPRPARGFLPADDQGARIAMLWGPMRPRLEPSGQEITERRRQATVRPPAAADNAPATEAEARLLELLDEAPAAGISPAELVQALADMGVKRSWIMAKLPQLERRGRARKVQRGLWKGVRPSRRLIVPTGGEQ